MDFIFYTESIKVLELLGNPNRLSIVCNLITYGSLSVSDLSKKTRISESVILQHLRKLVQGNIVISERKGKRLYCRLEDNKIVEMVKVLGLVS
ncbi:metalloregulator ArsR/SmtB family transcription factor [Bacillus sp. TH13]|uniref:ArsR/SmtB family transcription factor n=1 Tax=Bacillus sp. TH13 TaxID=2796379 RepID=UPI00191303ED|nr:metalloregulator ArsR/SmtB family transcription factor [Bacillus sp. TH13]MBK5491724.1 helix-turn-helix transcriptional regulator [Bacillus sp. TH13]